MKSNVKVKFAVYMNSNATNFCRNTIQNGTNQLTNAVYGSVVSITQRPHALITKQNNNSIHNKAVIHCRLCSRCCHLESYFTHARMHTHTHTHPFNGPFSGKTNLDFTEARDSEWQWNMPYASLHLAPDR